MRIYDPPKFGAHLKSLRMKNSVSVETMAEATGFPIKMYEALEEGLVGSKLDGKMIDALVEAIPGLSLATSPGVFPPPISRAQMRGDE